MDDFKGKHMAFENQNCLVTDRCVTSSLQLDIQQRTVKSACVSDRTLVLVLSRRFVSLIRTIHDNERGFDGAA